MRILDSWRSKDAPGGSTQLTEVKPGGYTGEWFRVLVGDIGIF
jgi:hypothetical protein